RNVALKVLIDECGGTDEEPDLARSRLLLEARSMAKLEHPNIVTVFEVGVASGRVFLAMQLVEGVTLAEWLTTRRARDDLLRLCDGVAAAVDAAHRAGVIHRDLKPQNIIVSRENEPKVTDFGLAERSRALLHPGPPRRVFRSGSAAPEGVPWQPTTTLLRSRG